MKKRGRYAEEFKCEVLRMAATSDKPLAELEQDLGVTAGLIRQWQQRYRLSEGPATTLQPSEERETKAEIRRLKRELEIVKQERDI